jgi:hypothetical protein
MGTVNQAENITIVVASGQTLSFSDADYDYRYYRVVVDGPQSSQVALTLNGAHMDLAGTTVLDAPIYSLEVTGGAGVAVFGVKSPRFLFGKYGSSSEGLT